MSPGSQIMLVIAGLFFVWVVTGGPGNESARHPFTILPQDPFVYDDFSSSESSQTRNDIEEIKEKVTSLENQILYSPLKGKVVLDSVYGVGPYGDAINEYAVIRTSYSNNSPVRLTGMKLKSVKTGQSVTIGQGAILPYTNLINSKEDIVLLPNSYAYVITGNSPIGTSFRLNMCTGYFEQFQDFNPYLPRECPLLEDEPQPAPPNHFSDECIDFIEDIPRCSVYTGTYPDYFPELCRRFIIEKGTYNSCVNMHKNESDFYKNTWRIYLSRSGKLWSARRDTIQLLDQNGKIVSEYEYRY